MSNYKKLIETTLLIDRVERTTTTGDLDYDGTALEVTSLDGDELFHVVVDAKGNRQFLFFRSEGNYRMPIELVERIIETAKEYVKPTDL